MKREFKLLDAVTAQTEGVTAQNDGRVACIQLIATSGPLGGSVQAALEVSMDASMWFTPAEFNSGNPVTLSPSDDESPDTIGFAFESFPWPFVRGLAATPTGDAVETTIWFRSLP